MSYTHNTMEKIHNSTKDKILKLLLSNKKKEFTIRAIAQNIKVDYKAVYLVTKQLIKTEVVNSKRAGQTVLCSINHKKFNSDIFRAETIRRDEVLDNKDVHVLYNNIKDEIQEHFFILLIFGSYASRQQRKGSDVDLMLVTDSESIKKKVKNIVSGTPLGIHLLDFKMGEFLSMLKTTDFNVGKEAFYNNVILFGIEDYHRMIENA